MRDSGDRGDDSEAPGVLAESLPSAESVARFVAHASPVEWAKLVAIAESLILAHACPDTPGQPFAEPEPGQ